MENSIKTYSNIFLKLKNTKIILIILFILVSLVGYSQSVKETDLYNKLFYEIKRSKSTGYGTKVLNQFQLYCQDYPNGFYLKKARKKSDNIVYEHILKAKDYILFDYYLINFPEGRYINEVKIIRQKVAEENYKKVVAENVIKSYNDYLSIHKTAEKQSNQVKSRIETLKYTAVINSKNTSEFTDNCKGYFIDNPTKVRADKVIQLWWEYVLNKNTVPFFKEFIFFSPPLNKYQSLAENKIHDLNYEHAKNQNTILSYEELLANDDGTPYKEEVEIRLNKMIENDKSSFWDAMSINTHRAYEKYLSDNRYGRYREKAQRLLKDLPVVSNIYGVANGNKIDIHFYVYVNKDNIVPFNRIYNNNNNSIVMNNISGDTKAYNRSGNYTITWDVLKDTKTLEGNVTFNIIVDKPYIKGTAFINGVSYNTIAIGDQVWMAENLKFDEGYGSTCFNDNPVNCDKYGRYYIWKNAKIAAAMVDGWHLPTEAEWIELLDYLGSESSSKVRSTTGWLNGKNGSNISGFSALPGGWDIGYYHNVGKLAIFWSYTIAADKQPIVIILPTKYSKSHAGGGVNGSYGTPIRLVKDK